MSSDEIVTRLRAVVVDQFYGEDQLAVTDAVDEIERLRHQVDDLRRCLEDTQFQIERRRAAGDALAAALGIWLGTFASYDANAALIDAWIEVRS